ncbi:MAG: thioredoxin [Bacteroidetes bacterium]|nr:thioredoxin [Bacteroidota bacterium]
MSESKVRIFTDDNVADYITKNPEKPILVDFWAPWCGPCRMQGPIIEDLAKTAGEDVIIAKCNVDENPAISSHLQIRSIPTLMIIKNQTVVEYMVGVQDAKSLTEKLAKHKVLVSA